MNLPLSGEMYWLLLTIVFTALMWVPYILNRMREFGVLKALWDPWGETATQVPWANRMMAAHVNAVENLVIFAPLVVMLQIFDVHSETTAVACMIYFAARVVHFLVFTFAVPVLRVISFVTGFVAQMVLAYQLLG